MAKTRSRAALRAARSKRQDLTWVPEGQTGHVPLPRPGALDGMEWDVQEKLPGFGAQTEFSQRVMQVSTSRTANRHSHLHEMLHVALTPRGETDAQIAALVADDCLPRLVQILEDVRLDEIEHRLFGSTVPQKAPKEVLEQGMEHIGHPSRLAAFEHRLALQEEIANRLALAMCFRSGEQPGYQVVVDALAQMRERSKTTGATKDAVIEMEKLPDEMVGGEGVKDAYVSVLTQRQESLSFLEDVVERTGQASLEDLESFSWTRKQVRLVYSQVASLIEWHGNVVNSLEKQRNEFLEALAKILGDLGQGGGARGVPRLTEEEIEFVREQSEVESYLDQQKCDYKGPKSGGQITKYYAVIGAQSGALKVIDMQGAKKHRAACHKSKPRARDAGDLMRFPGRFLVDERIFSQARREPGGSVLLDYSGSMDYEAQDIRELVHQLPMSRIATYAGGSVDGYLRIIAWEGMIVDDPASHPYASGNNVVDLPALEWLCKQPKPRVWVTDMGVSGIGGVAAEEIRDTCFHLANQSDVFIAANFWVARKWLTRQGFSFRKRK